MPLTQYAINEDLLDSLGVGPSVHAEVLFVPYGSHDSRVEDGNVLLGPIGPIRAQDLTDPYMLDEGSWTVTISTRAKSSSWRPVFQPITVTFEHDHDISWGDIVAGVVTDVPITPSVLQRAEDAADSAESAAASVQREQASGVAGLTAAGKLYEARIPDRLTDATLSSTFGPTAPPMLAAFPANSQASAAAQRVLARLKRNVEDVTLLNMSDSTGFYSSTENRWYYKLAQRLATDWPTHTVKFVPWDDTAQNWGTTLTIQTGSGSNTLWLYNAAVVGTRMDYFLGSRYPFITALQPDLVFANYGLNDGSTDVNGTKTFARERILTLTETVTADCPTASVIILTQNERTDVANAVNAIRASRYSRLAEQRGYGLVDTRQVFAEDSRGLAALLNGDGLHPNNIGSDLLADTVYRHFKYRVDAQPRPQLPSSFLATGPNLLTNGDFASFASPPTLPNWTAVNATLAKDTTNYEGPNGYSVNITAASAAASHITGTFNTRTVKGRWVTVAARVFIPTGQANTAGRLTIMCGDGSDATSIGITTARDGWIWVVASKRISPTATFAQARIYGDSAASGGANISVDRVVACLGQLPRDIR